MLRRNKLTKTFAFPIATGAAAIGVLAGSVLTATSASAAQLLWSDFKAGTPLIEGDKTIKYVDIGAADDVIRNNDTVELMENSPGEYMFIFSKGFGTAPFNFSASFQYTIEITDPNKIFVGVQVDSTVSNNFGQVNTLFAAPNINSDPLKPGFPNSITLTSLNGWPDPGNGFQPIPLGSELQKITVTNTIQPNAGGALTSISNQFIQATKSQSVPEPGTILGLITVGGLGLVSRFNRQK